ncbi:branched-subunit amino acid transport protein AzlD [Hoeflea marina]|uniref:Branched-subunit amino acid transport protein AzlD n=2 Tax=Hoeflea marina TaxID=274592 RepID=A0A317PQC9_9HYPH|nr:branched-subunit amino acid transport protein AzlD [Hoeflea marina]
MSYQWLDTWWWPYVFIAVAGWLATDLWRWLGVVVGARLKDDSLLLIWVRAVATALVAAVIAKLVLYPSGELKHVPVALRLLALGLGFAAFLALRQRVWVGIAVALAVLIGGQLLLG